MNYIFEAILVGIYSVFLFYIISQFISNDTYLQLFVVGFFKHLFGAYLNIHDYYCNYGYSCYLQNECENGNCRENKKYLFIRSLFEGFLYLIFGKILIELPISLKNIYLYFIIGVGLHLLFEYLQIHKYYCKTYCQAQSQA
jgi:hypothetical protein